VASYLTSGDLDSAYDDFGGDLARFMFTVAITSVLAIICYSGLEVVGQLSMVVCIVSMSPFLVMMLFAIPKMDVNRWLVLPEAGVSVFDDDGVGLIAAPIFAGVCWRPFLNSLFWNMVRTQYKYTCSV